MRKSVLKKAVPSMVSALLCAFTLCFYIPILSYQGNLNLFAFRLPDLLSAMALPFALTAAVLLAVGLLGNRLLAKWFPDRVETSANPAVALLICLVFCLWLEGFLLNRNLPQMTGELNLYRSMPRLLMDTAIWGVTLYLGVRYWRGVVKRIGIIALCLCLLLGLGIGDALMGSEPKSTSDVTASRVLDRLRVHPESNVIMLVLDSMSTALIQDFLVEFPEAESDMEGFVLFENNLETAYNTQYSLPSMLRGDLYQGGPILDYQTAFFSQPESLPQRFASQGYDVYMSSFVPLFNAMQAEDVGASEEAASLKVTPTLYGQLALRFAPYVAKNAISNRVGFMAGAFTERILPGGNLSALAEQDLEHYDKTTYEALSHAIGRPTSASPTLQIHHVNGAHMPYTIDREGNPLTDSQRYTRYGQSQQSQWTLRTTLELLAALKERDLYDSSSIVILGDHGDRLEDASRGNLLYGRHAGLLIKPAHHREPFRKSQAPASHLYLPEWIEALHIDGAHIDDLEKDLPSQRSIFHLESSAVNVFEGDDITRLRQVDSYKVEQVYTPGMIQEGTRYSFSMLQDELPILYPHALEKADITNGWGIKLLGEHSSVSLKTESAGTYAVTLQLTTAAPGGGEGIVEPYSIVFRDRASNQEYRYSIHEHKQEIQLSGVTAEDSLLQFDITLSLYSTAQQFFLNAISIEAS